MSPRQKWVGAALMVLALALAIVIVLVQKRTAPVAPTEVVPATWQVARTSPMHDAHVRRKKLECKECHTEGFAVAPDLTVCTKCHAAAAANAHHGKEKAPTTCLTCHAFGAGKVQATCRDCHARAENHADVDPSEKGRPARALNQHASKEIACAACHNVHGKVGTPAPRVVLADCTACHTSVIAVHGRASAAASGDEDAGEPFDAAVARLAANTGTALALRDGGSTATGHMCTACHAPHTRAVAARDSCATCHVARSGTAAAAPTSDVNRASSSAFTADVAPKVEPHGRRVAGHEACVTCHEPHRAKKTDVRACESCHADHSGATGVGGHVACTGCHAPHSPAEAKTSCASAGCHAGKAALAATRVAAHDACDSCHDPHKPGESPALACARCHDKIAPKHPTFAAKHGGPSACIGCHAPHPASAAAGGRATASACSSCHTKARGDRAFHSGGVACTNCHAPHDFASRLLRNADGRPAHGTPAPAAKAERAALCARCHAKPTSAVTTRPGHAACGGCHGDAHSPVKKPACATCHAQEAATARGGHTACTKCHDPHSGSLGTRAVCTNCHASKTKQLHGSLAGGCSSCHTAHGPKGVLTPPPCASCHATAKLAGLHAVSAHNAKCASCHTSHAPPRSDHATCTTSCHLNRHEHQPAAVCKGCHSF